MAVEALGTTTFLSTCFVAKTAPDKTLKVAASIRFVAGFFVATLCGVVIVCFFFQLKMPASAGCGIEQNAPSATARVNIKTRIASSF